MNRFRREGRGDRWRRTWALLAAISATTGCSGAEPAPDESIFIVEVLSPEGGTFTVAHVNEFGAGGGPTNQFGTPAVIEGMGTFEEVIRLSAGPVDPSLQFIRGSFSGSFLEVRFATRTLDFGGPGDGVGAEANSLVNTEGPDPIVSACSIRYGAATSTKTRYEVQFRFTDQPGSVCRGSQVRPMPLSEGRA